MSDDILVIAFDGLDYDLIEEFDLTEIKQQEFGRLDNTATGAIKTSELFASFITGKISTGVSGLKKYQNPKRGQYIRKFPDYLSENIRGFSTLKQILIDVVKPGERVHYSKEDLKDDTLFEKVSSSRAMFVPSYNPSPFWQIGGLYRALSLDIPVEENVELWRTREFRHRKEELFRELESDILESRPLLMCHFHWPDFYQHMYGDKAVGGFFDKEKLRTMYKEVDELSKEIKLKAENQGYDYVIFMSDHGLPTEKEHNENAFYSCNKELFGDETPHITDFHDKILELTGYNL